MWREAQCRAGYACSRHAIGYPTPQFRGTRRSGFLTCAEMGRWPPSADARNSRATRRAPRGSVVPAWAVSPTRWILYLTPHARKLYGAHRASQAHTCTSRPRGSRAAVTLLWVPPWPQSARGRYGAQVPPATKAISSTKGPDVFPRTGCCNSAGLPNPPLPWGTTNSQRFHSRF